MFTRRFSRFQARFKPALIVLPIILAGCSGQKTCLKPTEIASMDTGDTGDTGAGAAIPAGCRAIFNDQNTDVVSFECENGQSGFAFVVKP